MKTIYKYPLKVQDYQEIELPNKFEVLSIDVQHGNPFVWVLVNPAEKQMHTQRFYIFGTGHPIDDDVASNSIHIGTFQLLGGNLVYHVFQHN